MSILESEYLDWPIMIWDGDDGLASCMEELPPVPDKRYRGGLRLITCHGSIGPFDSARGLYEAVKEHAEAVQHRPAP